ISLMWTGPGPQWATGGDTLVDSVGSEARGSCRLSGGTVSLLTLPTDKMSDSVTFQKDFQKCKSRFWVMRSNSAPRSSGSMTYFPEVRRDRAAVPAERGKRITSKRERQSKAVFTSLLRKASTNKPNPLSMAYEVRLTWTHKSM
uniref:Uncharacterized protein n=1 Tax=Poecilia mexicana TaxID=48701 RepID=A0A3B3XZG1_9TELE